jgi:hypothetical protein
VKDGKHPYHLTWRALAAARRQQGGNTYNLRELAGAFGDLGTLIPFLVGYITIMKLDPVGVLVAFGLFKIIAGLYFKTPIPIQPMKAIGTAAISHAGALTAGSIWAAGLFSGLFWLLMGLTGTVTWISKITSRPVVHGLILGLGLSFILEGVRLMEGALAWRSPPWCSPSSCSPMSASLPCSSCSASAWSPPWSPNPPCSASSVGCPGICGCRSLP